MPVSIAKANVMHTASNEENILKIGSKYCAPPNDFVSSTSSSSTMFDLCAVRLCGFLFAVCKTLMVCDVVVFIVFIFIYFDVVVVGVVVVVSGCYFSPSHLTMDFYSPDTCYGNDGGMKIIIISWKMMHCTDCLYSPRWRQLCYRDAPNRIECLMHETFGSILSFEDSLIFRFTVHKETDNVVQHQHQHQTKQQQQKDMRTINTYKIDIFQCGKAV